MSSDRDESTASSSFLGTSSTFSDLGPDTVRAVVEAMEPREYSPGEYLIHQEGPADYLLLIVSGYGSAQVRDAPSDRTPIGQFGPGDVVGEMSLLTDESRTADVVARTSVRALRLSADAFHKLTDRYPELRVVLTNVMADRLGQARYDGLGGKDIHGYRIIQCLGRGGMGIVYQAERVATGETVALKMLNHRRVYQPGGLHRFRREATILKSLNHELIARVYDFFPAYKTEFLVMEFCSGSTLTDVIATRRLLDEQVVRTLIGQLAIALRYIHSHGIVHRDLKPSNVMVADSGTIKLLDFGVVKLDSVAAEWADVQTASVSSSTTLLGTLRYMSPEQLAGQSPDSRADIYGLACIAYEALCGKPVIEASDLFGIVSEHMRFALPPRDQIGPGVSIEMYDLLTRGLDPAPDKRIVDLDQLVAWAGPMDLGAQFQ
jgi:predicted Ser/Thr protein kinase